MAQLTVKEARDVFEARRVIERVTTEIVTRTILTYQLKRAAPPARASKSRNWTRGNCKPVAINGISGFHLSLASLAQNGALTTAQERLIIRTSLILGLYRTTRTYAALPPYYRDLDGPHRFRAEPDSIAADRTLPVRHRWRTRLLSAVASRGRLEAPHANRWLTGFGVAASFWNYGTLHSNYRCRPTRSASNPGAVDGQRARFFRRIVFLKMRMRARVFGLARFHLAGLGVGA